MEAQEQLDAIEPGAEIHNLEDLAAGIGCRASEISIAAAVYNGTDCGAWIEWEADGIVLGSVVEGTQLVAAGRYLRFPFTMDQFWAVLGEVDAAATFVWNQTHGCPDCWNGEVTVNAYEWEAGPDDQGARLVDPDCPTCGGHGIVC